MCGHCFPKAARGRPSGGRICAARTFSLGKLTREGLIMEQLEIVDLGDAMTETRCSMAIGPQFDFLYGAGHWRC